MPRDPQTGRFLPKVQKVEAPRGDLTNELGVHTTRRMGRSLYDDYLPQLRGRRASRVYREMADGNAVIGGFLFAVESIIREVEWYVEPADDTPQAEQWATFVDECLDDMTHTWQDHVSAALTFLPYGFSAFETVYRRRTESSGSRFSDGKWGWRKHAYRPQDTIERFHLDEKGGVEFIVQGTDLGEVPIPIEKSVLYRTTTARGPEGRSILRNAYTSWFLLKRSQEIMMIGIERDLAGLPMARIPAESLIAKDDIYEAVKDMVTRTKRDEQEGIIMPSDTDENGNLLYDFALLTPAGGAERLAGVLAITRSLAQDILASVLADFMGLGRDSVGSRALADPKIDLWMKALDTWADVIADTMTRHAIPRLIQLNGGNLALCPKLKHGPVAETDVKALSEAVKNFSQSGLDFLDDNAQMRFRDMLGLDPLEE